MIGYCGLDCGQCEAFIATQNDDNALRAKVAEKWAKLNNAPIRPEHINCTGCHSAGVRTYYCDHLCAIRKCAAEKRVCVRKVTGESDFACAAHAGAL